MKVIKIGATWCSGCLVMKPRWAEIEKENPWLSTAFYDYDGAPEIVAQHHIDENLPVAIFLDTNGNEIKRFTGEISKHEIEEAISSLRDK